MQIWSAAAMPPHSGQGGLMERRPAILAVNQELVIDDRLRQLAALDRIAGGCKRFVPRHCPHEIAVAAQIWSAAAMPPLFAARPGRAGVAACPRHRRTSGGMAAALRPQWYDRAPCRTSSSST